MDNKQPIPVFRTTDIQLIAYLRLNGYRVERIEKINNYKAEFVVVDVDRELLEDFNNGNTLVEPRSFGNMMHQMVQSAKTKIRE